MPQSPDEEKEIERLAILAVANSAQDTKWAIRRLPPFSPVAVKILLMLRQPEVSYRAVADALLTDAALSAEVLRLANSAAIGCRFPTSSILQALTVLGIPRISALTASLTMCKLLKPLSRLPLVRVCWRHNLATALTSAEIAPRFRIEPDHAYVFGLLHDIGRLALLVSFPKDYPLLVVEAVRDPSSSLVALEKQAFGLDHREAGVWVTDQWRLPPDLKEVCLGHGPGTQPSTTLARLVDEACGIANRLGFGVLETPPNAVADTTDSTGVGERVRNYESEYGL